MKNLKADLTQALDVGGFQNFQDFLKIKSSLCGPPDLVRISSKYHSSVQDS